MLNDRNGKCASIFYLPFDRNTKKKVNDKIVFEGPLLICERVFEKRKICDLSVIIQADYNNYGKLKYNFLDK